MQTLDPVTWEQVDTEKDRVLFSVGSQDNN